MKHFIFFVILVFAGLSALYLHKEDSAKNVEDKKIHIYASSSFIAKWGPGPELKELFEKQSLFKIEFVESPDVNMTLQKIGYEAENSLADVVLGLDQFDISRLASKIKWRDIDRSANLTYVNEVKSVASERSFVPYDWAPLTFITRKNFPIAVANLKDLMNEQLKGRIALQDPRTSSPGMHFLVWLFENKSADEAVKILKSMNKQAHSFSPSWSTAYGIFKDSQADLVYSYITSPVYHQVEESDSNYMGIETAEPLSAQVEFVGIPATCKNCEAAEMFVNFLLTPDAQKIIMSKNYMFPVIERVKEATPFDAIKVYKTLPVKFYDQTRIEKWINTWSEIRKNDGD
jgi:thiamine transport system substrate-binding protein